MHLLQLQGDREFQMLTCKLSSIIWDKFMQTILYWKMYFKFWASMPDLKSGTSPNISQPVGGSVDHSNWRCLLLQLTEAPDWCCDFILFKAETSQSLFQCFWSLKVINISCITFFRLQARVPSEENSNILFQQQNGSYKVGLLSRPLWVYLYMENTDRCLMVALFGKLANHEW